MRPLDAGRVENGDRVRGHLRGGVRPGRHVALADAAVVEAEHVEALGEQLPAGAPAEAIVSEPLDQQQGRPGARAFPGQPHAVPLGDAHTPASACSRRPAADSIRRRARARPRAEMPTMPPGKK